LTAFKKEFIKDILGYMDTFKSRSMLRKIFFSLWIGVVFFLIPPIHEVRAAIAITSTPSPSIPSFGIQRFNDKKEAPPFSLTTLNGNQVSLSDFKGKPVLLFFWVTWCESCKEEMPSIEEFAKKTKELVFLFMAIDGERKERIRKIIKEKKVTLPVLLLAGTPGDKLMEQYKVGGWVPQTYLIDQRGTLIGKMVGPRDWSSPEAWSSIKEVFGLH
jgi:peroxiredoxin